MFLISTIMSIFGIPSKSDESKASVDPDNTVEVFNCKFGIDRMLWMDFSQISGGASLINLNAFDKVLQEKIFELITSEATYLRNLNMLIKYFYMSPKLDGETSKHGGVITSREKELLFGNILQVQAMCNGFFSTLYESARQNVALNDIFDITHDYLKEAHSTLAIYCCNLAYQQKTLEHLNATNPSFVKCIARIEKSQPRKSQSLNSLLIQPFQRVVRYPLLMQTCLEMMSENDSRTESVKRALNVAKSLVSRCNDQIEQMENAKILAKLEYLLIYTKKSPRRLPLLSPRRKFLMQDMFFCSPIGPLESRPKYKWKCCQLFLFNDIVVIARLGKNKQLYVMNYFHRESIIALQYRFEATTKGSFVDGDKFAFCLFFYQSQRELDGRMVCFANDEETTKNWLVHLQNGFDANGEAKKRKFTNEEDNILSKTGKIFVPAQIPRRHTI